MKIVKLTNFKISTNKFKIHSNVLFSAIVDILNRAYDDLTDDFLNDFYISSAFPFIDNKLYIPFNFRVLKINNDTVVDKSLFKKQFISLDYINDNTLDLNSIKDNPNILSESDILENNFNSYNGLSFISLNRVMINRSSNISNESKNKLFSVDYIISNSSKSGLYFIFNDKFEKEVRKALDIIKTEGILYKKSLFNGLEYKIEDISLPTTGRYFISLSSFYPSYEDIKNIKNTMDNLVFFKLSKYVGYTSIFNKNIPKPQIKYLEEGSIFKTYRKDKDYYGKNILIESNEQNNLINNIILYGKTIPLFINLKK